MRTYAAASAAIVVYLAASGAMAQEQPQDIVRLRDGGFVRGTISEFRPGEYVIIVLQNGEERRFEAAEIESVGPASEVQPPAPPPVLPNPPIPMVLQVPPAPSATVRFESEQPGLRIFRVVGVRQDLSVSHSRYASNVRLVTRPVHEHVCDAPCDAVFGLGIFALGVSTGGRVFTPEAPEIGIAGPTRVNVRWNDRGTIRWIGTILALAGGLIGAAGAIGGIYGFVENNRRADTTSWLGLAISGGVLMAASLTVGFSLAFWWDGYRLEQDPPAVIPERR